MDFDKDRLENWILKIPECKEFLSNFFISCKEDFVSAFVNYMRDIDSYSLNYKSIRQNRQSLLRAFKDISGMKVYYGRFG